MHKTLKLVGITFVGIVCFIFVTFSIIHMARVNSKMDEWNESHKSIKKDVSAFVKVSDPKTIRLYVKQLNDILDNMTRLYRLIDSGEELDIAIGQYEREYIKLQTKVFELIEEVELVRVKLRIQEESLDEFVDESLDASDSLSIVIESKDLRLIKKFDIIQDELNDIKNDLKSIKDSKINKFW